MFFSVSVWLVFVCLTVSPSVGLFSKWFLFSFGTSTVVCLPGFVCLFLFSSVSVRFRLIGPLFVSLSAFFACVQWTVSVFQLWMCAFVVVIFKR